jgi:hypothetical protein
MAESETVSAEADKPFASLQDLRNEHARLLRSSGRGKQEQVPPETIRAFLKKAQAVGALIGAASEREAAQNILDYWTASLMTSSVEDAQSASSVELAEFDPTNAPSLIDKENPYPGLGTFAEKDAGQFLGREDAIRILLETVRRHALVFVIGALGSGKTSLVSAGVLPRLAGAFASEGVKWKILPVVTPGADPIGALLRAVYQIAPSGTWPELSAWVTREKAEILRRPSRFRDLLATAAGGPAVLVVDAFEEVFFVREAEAREAFVRAVASVANGDDASKTILIVRDDWADQALQLETLKPFATADAEFSPPPPTSAELRRIIEVPAKAVGLQFDAGVVDDLIKEVSGEPTGLAMLQFTLVQLWEHRDRDRITGKVYEEVGRPREALTRTAEKVYVALSAEEQAIAKAIFAELVQPGAGGTSQRRRPRRDRLLQVGDPEQVTKVLDAFVGCKLLRMTPGLTDDEDRYEVAHEALIQRWPRLQEWLRNEGAKSEKKIQLLAAARLYQKSGQNVGYLLTDEAALAEASQYRDAAPELRDYVSASEQYIRTRYRVKVGLFSGAAVFLLIAVAVLTVMMFAIWSAKEKESVALDNERGARADAERALNLAETRATEARDAVKAAQKEVDGLKRRIADLEKSAGQQSDLTDEVPKNVAQVRAPLQAQQGYVWIGSDTSSKIQDQLPSKAVKGAKYKLTTSLVFRDAPPKSADDYTQGASLGILPEGTTITVTDDPIAYNRASGVQYWVAAHVEEIARPTVYFQFTGGPREAAKRVSGELQARGYTVPGEEMLASARNLNEVRYFYASDKAAADMLAADVTAALRKLGMPPSAETKARDFTTYASKKNRSGIVELWLDLPGS